MVGEDTLIAIARKIRPQVADKEQALKELNRAADIAAEMAARGAVPGNTDDYVDAVIKRLNELTVAGDLDAAVAEADRAFDEWEARQAREAANGSRLLGAAIDQHLLAFDAEGAAAKIARRVGLDTPDPAARIDALREVGRIWQERGRNKGLNLNLHVAIKLAGIVLDHADNPDRRGVALADLGTALSLLRERESGTDRLEEAVDACRAALEELTRDRVSLHWAVTQMNLGTALQALGQRESGTDRLEGAVDAYRAAQEELTRDRVPLDWAATYGNIARVHVVLFDKTGDAAELDQAQAALDAAQEVFARAQTSQYLAFVDSAQAEIDARRRG